MKIANWIKSNFLIFALVGLAVWAIFQVWNPVSKAGKMLRAGVEWIVCALAVLGLLAFLLAGEFFALGALLLFGIAVVYGYNASTDTGYANGNPPADFSAGTDGSNSG